MNDSDDDYELVQCEEIMVSDSDDEDEACSSEPQKNATNKKTVKTKSVNLNMMPSDNLNNMSDSAKLKYIRRPTRPVRLFSFTDRDILNRFSKTNEASKTLAMQLLNIVKSVNMRRKVKIENGTVVPNFYIMATKCEANEKRKITEMDSISIVNLVKDIIHMIKIGMYRKVDFVEIICDSPAIFLIKYINVKHWDPIMNAVYVVTSEYLLPYLCKIKAAEEQEETARNRLVSKLKPAGTKRKKPESEESGKRKTPDFTAPKNTNVVVKTQPKQVASGGSGVVCSKSDEEMVEAILGRYLEPDAVHFFITQMKVSGKTYNQYRWKDDDKILALKLMRNNPAEYSALFQKFTLPSDKTLEKFVNKIRNRNN